LHTVANAWLEALRNNLVVAVRHDRPSGFKTWMHGEPNVLEYVRNRELDWRWSQFNPMIPLK